MMGMAPSELYALELCEFLAIYEGWRRLREQSSRELWEVARWQSAIAISPHVQQQKPLTELLPLPWDRKSVNDVDVDIEVRKEQALKMLKILKNEQ